MPKIITTSYLNETKFYQMPKAFFHNPLYMNMKNESKIAYTLLRDLLTLSIENNWINENNEVYVKLCREKMMKYLQIKKDKHADVMKELIAKELIVKKRLGLNRVDEIYVCIPEELDKIYSDSELLEFEENDKKEPSNVDESRKSEKQTSRSLENRPPEVDNSDFKRSEKQTYTNTNSIETNSINISNISNTSSKGEKSPLVIFFEENICELKKTTLPKFKAYEKKYDSEFIKAIISYGAKTNAKSYNWFEITIESYIAKNMFTAYEVEEHISAFYEDNKSAKDRALKQKEEKRKISEESHKRDIAGYDAMNHLDLPEVTYDTTNGESLNEIKEVMKGIMTQTGIMSEVSYNTWIANLDFVKLENKVVIECPNSFTRETIEKRYFVNILEILRTMGIEENLVTTIKK